MKKLILALFLVLVMATSAIALGTVTITSSTIQVQGQPTRKIITLSWVADASEATVPSTTISAATYGIEGWYLYSGETNPGDTAPTSGYSIAINDADGLDIAFGCLANRHTSSTELVNIFDAVTKKIYPVVRGNLTFVLTGNAVNSATGTCILIFVAN